MLEIAKACISTSLSYFIKSTTIKTILSFKNIIFIRYKTIMPDEE